MCTRTQGQVLPEHASATSQVVRQFNFATLDQTMGDRLSALGRVTLPFEPLQWFQGMKASTGSGEGHTDGNPKHLASLALRIQGIYGKRDYTDAYGVLQSNPAYMDHLSSKPKCSSAFFKDWKAEEIEAKFKFVSSIRFPCQEIEVITTIQETEIAEGNRILTWLYLTTDAREASRKRDANKKKEKDSRGPTNDLDADRGDDED